MPISKAAFDGAAAWAALPADVQAQVGALAMEAAVAAWIADTAQEQAAVRAGVWGLGAALDGIEALFVVGQVAARDDAGAWMLPSVLGEVCHRCGCSHEDPCEEGCGWAAENLCTACAKPRDPAPDLARGEAAAVRRGACAAVQESPLADPATLAPLGAELRGLAEKIATMHLEEEQTHG